MKKLIFMALFVVAIAVTPVFAQTIPAGQTLEGYIAGLRASIERMTRELNQLLAQQRGDWCYDFNRNFGVGEKGEIVDRLIKNLKPEISANYPEFNDNVLAWVKEFQTKYGIPSTGYVGSLTRAKLNELYGCKTQALKVVDPNGGEKWQIGSTQTIKWAGGDQSKSVNLGLISLSANHACMKKGGSICPMDISNVVDIIRGASNTGSYVWKVDLQNDYNNKYGGRFWLVVSQDAGARAESDEVFDIIPATVSAAALTVTAPNGGEQWVAYDTKDITWDWPNAKRTDKVDIFLTPPLSPCPVNLSCDPASPIVLDKDINVRALYHWIVGTDIGNKLIPPGKYIVSVCSSKNDIPCDSSDAYFTIVAPAHKLRVCPDEKIIDAIPTGSGPTDELGLVTYFIMNGTRWELEHFDLGWVTRNCSVKEQTVY